MDNVSREIIVYKLNANPNNETLGYLRVLAEKIEENYISLNDDSFCPSQQVFVTSEYEKIEERYSDFEIFKVSVRESERTEEKIKYVAYGTNHKPLRPRDLVEIISAPLPNPNDMQVFCLNIPSTTYIYLDDKGTCYGPFKWDVLPDNENVIQIMKIDSPLPGKKTGGGDIFYGKCDELFKSHGFECEIKEGIRIYFKNLTDLHNDTCLKVMDFSSDEDIVHQFIKISKEIGFNKKSIDLKTLEVKVKQNPSYRSNKFTLDKLEKLKDIYQEEESYKTEVMQGFTKFLRSDMAKGIVDSYIKNNKEMYLSDMRDDYRAKLENEFRSKNEELTNLKEKIDLNKEELKDLGSKIEEADRNKNHTKEIADYEKIANLEKEIEEKDLVLTRLKTEIKPLSAKYEVYKNLTEIEEKFEVLKRDYDYEYRRKLDIGSEIEKLEEKYNQHEDKLRKKLFELKPFVEAINGNVGFSGEENQKSIATQLTVFDKDKNTVADILHFIRGQFSKQKRVISTVDVINIVITLQQSFICFLAGLPGGGKTSLAKLVAKIYGIHDKRFVNVPVARGWTGQKDLIGYFNPISNKFQPSNTGLYIYLKALHDENKLSSEIPLSLVLLDEANLSPMEHYWSSFMGLTDGNDSKKLTLGNQEVNISDSLKFIATINYDSTTEYLSPRLIDRAPIIVVEPNSLHEQDEYSDDFLDKNTTSMPLSHEIMEYYFGRVDDNIKLLNNEERVFEKIKNILENRQSEYGKIVIVSTRKEIAIRQYCHKARPLMRDYSTDAYNELLALDYAILQFVLPLIRGNGLSFKKRLEKLKELLSQEELERSERYLDNIIISGHADLDTYDFFCW